MKRIISYISFFCLLYLVACEDVNNMHEKYLEEGEVVYTGIIDSLKSYPGNNRVKFTWEVNSDPRITKTVIYWNESKDSSVVAVKRTQPGVMQMETTLNVPEGSYIFRFYTKDNEGHKSVYVEKTVEVYGQKYMDMLHVRSINSSTATSASEVRLNWAAVDDATLQYTVLRYMDYTDPATPVEKQLRIENAETQTVLTGVKLGTPFTTVTYYLPSPEALDEVGITSPEMNFPRYYNLDKTGWTVTATSEELTGEGAVNGRATCILDNNEATFWHSRWNGGNDPLPHILTVDMQKTVYISEIRLARRQGNGDTKLVDFEASTDNVNWSPIGAFTFIAVNGPQTYPVESGYARYLRIIVPDRAPQTSRNASLGELYVIGSTE